MSNKCRIPKKPIIVIKIFLSVCFRTMYVWCASLFCCCCSVAQSCPTLIEPMVSLSFTISQSWLKLMSIESMLPSSHLILCCPLLLFPWLADGHLLLVSSCGLCSVCCYSVAKSCLTLCNPMDCSTPGSPVPHYLPELAQTHVH